MHIVADKSICWPNSSKPQRSLSRLPVITGKTRLTARGRNDILKPEEE